MSWFKKKTNKKESGNRLRGPCSRQSSSSCSQRQMFLTHFCPEEYQLDLWLRRLRDVVTKRFTSGLLIFVLAPDISTIILAFLRRRFSTESGFNSGKFLSYLAISLLLKGLTLTATLTASSVDIFCSFRSPTTKCVSTKTALLNGFLYLVLSWFPASSLWSGARSAGVLEGPG